MASNDLYLISAGRGPGANQSYWYTTVWIHNPGQDTAVVSVSLLLRNQSNPAPAQQTVAVDPGKTLTIGDAMHDLFGEEVAYGALRFSSTGKVVVSSVAATPTWVTTAAKSLPGRASKVTRTTSPRSISPMSPSGTATMT